MRKLLLFGIIVVSIILLSSNSANADDVNYQYKPDIKDELYSDIAVRLNTEIYNIADKYVNYNQLCKCINPSNKMALTAMEFYTPLHPIAITTMETGMWADHSITWSSAVYSGICEINWDIVHISNVDISMYNVLGLSKYTDCGSNCTGNHLSYSYHKGIGYNDNDSIGPMQILRRYIEKSNYCKTYDCCGESVVDLMSWEDNVKYFIHNHGGAVFRVDNDNNEKAIDNPYELMAIISIAHNSGTGFCTSAKVAGNTWNSADSIFDLCEKFGDEKVVNVFFNHVNLWYNELLTNNSLNTDFVLPGQYSKEQLDIILSEAGIDLNSYATSVTGKQYYPIRGVLNYMAYEFLYGGEVFARTIR